MHTLITKPLALPAPRVPLAFRLATLADLPAIDALQKRHHKALGFFPRAQMQGYVENGWVLVAEEGREERGETRETEDGALGGREEKGEIRETGINVAPAASRITPLSSRPPLLGYLASRDRYLKRDELGVVYQLCVEPAAQRGNVGAALVAEMFRRSAYGCRLYGCWCAQDLPANRFWASLGFVPIAFRGGSKRRSRVHIFWQRRVNADDVSTPYWYPSQTTGGAIREDRIVLPIPPGVSWEEVGKTRNAECGVMNEGSKAKARRKALPAPKSSIPHSALTAPQSAAITAGGLRFGAPTPPPTPVNGKAAKAKAPKEKADPKLVAAARELRDRWLERLNASDALRTGSGKYDVTRAMAGPATVRQIEPTKLLPAA